jgi:hypothetical protein
MTLRALDCSGLSGVIENKDGAEGRPSKELLIRDDRSSAVSFRVGMLGKDSTQMAGRTESRDA